MNLYDLPTGIPWLSIIWLVPVIAAFGVLLIPETQKQTIRIAGTLAALICLALTSALYGAYDTTSAQTFQFTERLAWLPQFGITYLLGVDGISLALMLMTGIVLVASCLISWSVETRVREYWALMLLLAAGGFGVFLSLDLFLLFIFYELTLLPKFLLIGVWGSTRKEYGATKLALYLMGGSALILFGMVAIYFGSTFRTFDLRLLSQAGLFAPAMQAAIFLPLFLGFAVLAGLFPLHTWAPTGHVAAPTAASMLLAGVMMKLGSYGCLRIAIGLLPVGAQTWVWPLALLAVIGGIVTAMTAIVQRDFKFMVGYSSISHMAMVLIGLASANVIGLTGAVLQMFAHGITGALLFAVVGRMVYERTHTRQFPELGGLAQSMPGVAFFFAVAALAGMGMPGFVGFWAELNILMGLWASFPLIAVLAALIIPITAGYMLNATVRVFFGELKNTAFAQLPKLTWPELLAGGLLTATLLAGGLYPAFLTEPIAASVRPIAAALQQAAGVALR